MGQNTSDTATGGFWGFFGGMIAFVNWAWIDGNFLISLIKAGATAVVCGFGGVAGKHVYTWLSRKWKDRKKKGGRE